MAFVWIGTNMVILRLLMILRLQPQFYGAMTILANTKHQWGAGQHVGRHKRHHDESGYGWVEDPHTGLTTI